MLPKRLADSCLRVLPRSLVLLFSSHQVHQRREGTSRAHRRGTAGPRTRVRGDVRRQGLGANTQTCTHAADGCRRERTRWHLAVECTWSVADARTSSSGFDSSPLSLSLRSQGIGISAEDLSKLFQSFSQAKDISSRYGGTGLGLVSVGQTDTCARSQSLCMLR